MKKITLGIISLFIIVVACHKKAVPTVTDRTDHPAAPVADSAKISQVPPLLAPLNAEMEAGKVIYTTKCVKCHMAKPVEKWTVEQWQPILRSMIPKAKLDSIESSHLNVYVNQFAKKAAL